MPAAATFYAVTGGVDTYWRVEVPARAVNGRAVLIHETETGVLERPARFAWPGQFSWFHGKDGTAVYPHHEGTAVWTRPCKARAIHADRMRDHDIRVLAEVDDNYLSASHLNLFMRANSYDDGNRIDHIRAMSCFDGIVYSTAWLRDRYVKSFREIGRETPEPFVCRNHVDLADWPERIEGDGRLRVGWMGSSQHARDLKMIAQTFHWAKEAWHCETVLIGHDVRDLNSVNSRRAQDQTKLWATMITRHIPWADPAVYHRTPLPLDIGLAPLELNDHTLGKSDVKAIEYAMSGAVPVLQNHPVYATHWKHNETCLLASSRDHFTHCVQELVRSRSLRERLVSAAQAYVREERSNEMAAKEWGEAIAA